MIIMNSFYMFNISHWLSYKHSFKMLKMQENLQTGTLRWGIALIGLQGSKLKANKESLK